MPTVKLISADDYNELPEFAADATFAYGDDPLHSAELYVPTTGTAHPVVVLVHGGCWRAMYGAKPLGGIARALADAGMAVWNIDYRRNGNGGGYPQTLVDVSRAADYLHRIADEYALDLTRIVTMGHSAGGSLALWLASRPQISPLGRLYAPRPLPIKGVVCLAGIVDLVAAVGQRICGSDMPTFMGGTPDAMPDHYADMSPMARLPLGVPHTHIVGVHDEGILANVRPYVAAAQGAGDSVELILEPDAGHFEIVVPTTLAWNTVQAAAVRLLA